MSFWFYIAVSKVVFNHSFVFFEFSVLYVRAFVTCINKIQ